MTLPRYPIRRALAALVDLICWPRNYAIERWAAGLNLDDEKD